MNAQPSQRDPLDVELGRLPWYGFIAIPASALVFFGALFLSLDGLIAPLAAVLLLEAVFLAAALWPAKLLGGVIVAWAAVVLTALSLLGVAIFLIASNGGAGFLVSVAIFERAIVAFVGALLVLQLFVVVHRLRGVKH